MAGNISRVPQALVADTHLELTKAMLVHNIKQNKEYSYQIVHDGKQWYAWFCETVQQPPLKKR